MNKKGQLMGMGLGILGIIILIVLNGITLLQGQLVVEPLIPHFVVYNLIATIMVIVGKFSGG